jgi:2-methylisocitrate lyase-like PEP mutase family enzyme
MEIGGRIVMASQQDRARQFAALHIPGNPVILYNAWDPGSAKAVAEAGARAIALGSHPVANAFGFEDGQKMPLDLVLANAERVVAAVDLPVTVDFEGGYALAPEEVGANVALLAATGAIGCNFEDQVIGGEGLHPIAFQAERIRAIRTAVGPDFFINARTDMFIKARGSGTVPDDAMVDAALERAHAFAEAGASGFFAPVLADLALLERLCAASPLPVNFIAFPGAPPARDVARAGVARISHGPFPYKQAMKTLTEAAAAAMDLGTQAA